MKLNNLYKLFRIQCEDLLCLAEMEYNGMLFAKEEALKKASSLQEETERLEREFTSLIGNVPASISSGAHLSAVLYGGTIVEELRIPIGVYKSGAKVGETRYKLSKVEYSLERLVKPLPKTETAASIKLREKGESTEETQWSVAEDILKKLKANKKPRQIISIVLQYRQVEKLRNTYLEGWSNLIDTKRWENNYIHSNLNQCIAETGRLSSTSPNVQNADKETKKFLVSRYDS